jgi:hypothetical protein
VFEGGLLRSQPAEGGGLIICGVVHLDGEKCSRCILLRQVDSKSLADIGHHGPHLKLQSLDTIYLLAFLRRFCFGLTAFFRLFALSSFGAVLSLFDLFAHFLLRELFQLHEATILGFGVGTVWNQLHFLDIHSLYIKNNLRNGFGLVVLVETSDLHFVLDYTFNNKIKLKSAIKNEIDASICIIAHLCAPMPLATMLRCQHPAASRVGG